MKLVVTYYPNGGFYCFTVYNGDLQHTHSTEYKNKYDCFRAGAQWILDNL